MTTAREFTDRLAELLRHERAAMADFLLALADFDRQRLWSELGHASLFSFLRRELGLSAGAAQYRKTAAELVQEYPEVEAALRAGRLCLSSVVELAKVITPENAAEVLPRFFGLSSRDAAFVAASIRPVENAPCREVVTSLPLQAAASAPGGSGVPERSAVSGGGCDPAPQPLGVSEAAIAVRAPEMPPPPASAPPATPPTPAARAPSAGGRPTKVEPLDAERVRLHVAVSRRFLAKLEATKDALSHARPGAGAAEALEACMDLLLAHHAKRRGLVEKPRRSAGPSNPGAVPAAVKRAVWHRAGGRCEWPLHSGGVCGSTVRLEFDHITPRALGGPSTVENVRLACRPHNLLAARRVFGDAWMDRYAGARRDGAGSGKDERGRMPESRNGRRRAPDMNAGSPPARGRERNAVCCWKLSRGGGRP